MSRAYGNRPYDAFPRKRPVADRLGTGPGTPDRLQPNQPSKCLDTILGDN